MTPSMIIAVIGAVTGILGTLTASIAIIQTRKANQLAKDANTLAKESNRISKDSERIASEANGLAAKANKISGDANSISQRALSVSADQTAYDWGFKFDNESSTLTVTNDSPNPATDVSVSVRHEGKTIAESHIDIMAPFENAPLKCELLSEKIGESQRSIDGINATGRVVFIGVGRVSVDLAVTWSSALGVKRSEKFEQSFS